VTTGEQPACIPAPWPADYAPFHPRFWLTNSHTQTILGSLLPRRNQLPAPVEQLVEVSPARGQQISSQVLCECHWQPPAVRATRPTAILLHGLEGSSHSQYVIGNANKLWLAGCNVIRMNMRNCGGRNYQMAALTPSLYHSGLSADVDHVMRFFLAAEGLQSVALLGYSMGANIMLKLAGELAAAAPPQLHAVVGVSPAIDLAESADALHIGFNRFYERRFLRSLLKRFRRKVMLFPRAFDPERATGIASHAPVRRPHHRALLRLQLRRRLLPPRRGSARVLDRIAVPTLLLHACDDPFIRFTSETRAAIAANPHITLLETAHGGHCAFLATPTRDNDGYWAEHTALAHSSCSPTPDVS
jgi:predicted alpha/beta-fold hydrolase